MESVYKSLAQKYEQARLAKAENEVSLKVAAEPFVPSKGMPRGTAKKTVIVGLLLGFLCLGVVYGKELLSKLKEEATGR